MQTRHSKRKKKCFHDLRNSEDLLFFSLQDFQNEMSSKQPEIDQLTKSDRRRSQSVSGEPVSHIPMFKGLSGRRTPTPVKYGRYVHKEHSQGLPKMDCLVSQWQNC